MSEKTTKTNGGYEAKEEILRRLPKRLIYLMRYGAVKEGLSVDENGYVDIAEVITTPLLSAYSLEEILNEVKTSMSYRNTHRYEWRERDNRIIIRAAYLRKFEQSPVHPGTKVKTLAETSMVCVLDNLDMFDLEEFQDEYAIKNMIRRLKRKKTITNKALSVLFVPTITRIDLEGIYLTNNTLRMLWTQCPHLRGISLKNCGYIITDTMLTQLSKNLPMLEQLNLSRCSHLTDKCLAILSKRLPHLKMLHIACVPAIKPKSVDSFLGAAQELTFLDVFYMKTTVEEYSSLMKKAASLKIRLVLHSPKDKLPRKEERSYSDEDQEEKANGNYDDDDGDGDDDNDGGDDDDDYQYDSDNVADLSDENPELA